MRRFCQRSTPAVSRTALLVFATPPGWIDTFMRPIRLTTENVECLGQLFEGEEMMGD